MIPKNDEWKFDKRIVNKHINKKRIKKEEFTDHIKNLQDEENNFEFVTISETDNEQEKEEESNLGEETKAE